MPKQLRIRHERAIFRDLPHHLRGLRILHITDLHGRSSNKINIDIWKKISNLRFDMAVITGDMVVNDIMQLTPHLNGLYQMARRVPVFYVDGNHEVYFYEEMVKLLRHLGVTVLNNRQGNFAVGPVSGRADSVVSVAGFRDYNFLAAHKFRGVWDFIDNIGKSGRFHIILTHQPQIFDWFCAERSNIRSALVLAGHTHGGQVRLPFFPTLFAPGQGVFPKYGDGWYDNNDGRLKMYISRGIGATVFSVRLFNPPEVALIELLRK